MKSLSIILALASTALPAVLASPAVPLVQDAVDWTAGSLSRIGQSSNDGAHTAASWTFVDCGDVDDAIEMCFAVQSRD